MGLVVTILEQYCNSLPNQHNIKKRHSFTKLHLLTLKSNIQNTTDSTQRKLLPESGGPFSAALISPYINWVVFMFLLSYTFGFSLTLHSSYCLDARCADQHNIMKEWGMLHQWSSYEWSDPPGWGVWLVRSLLCDPPGLSPHTSHHLVITWVTTSDDAVTTDHDPLSEAQ